MKVPMILHETLKTKLKENNPICCSGNCSPQENRCIYIGFIEDGIYQCCVVPESEIQKDELDEVERRKEKYLQYLIDTYGIGTLSRMTTPEVLEIMVTHTICNGENFLLKFSYSLLKILEVYRKIGWGVMRSERTYLFIPGSRFQKEGDVYFDIDDIPKDLSLEQTERILLDDQNTYSECFIERILENYNLVLYRKEGMEFLYYIVLQGSIYILRSNYLVFPEEFARKNRVRYIRRKTTLSAEKAIEIDNCFIKNNYYWKYWKEGSRVSNIVDDLNRLSIEFSENDFSTPEISYFERETVLGDLVDDGIIVRIPVIRRDKSLDITIKLIKDKFEELTKYIERNCLPKAARRQNLSKNERYVLEKVSFVKSDSMLEYNYKIERK